jgi:hypothetical protein
MDETVLTWTVPNWITVLLMVFVGFAIVGFATKTLVSMRKKNA